MKFLQTLPPVPKGISSWFDVQNLSSSLEKCNYQRHYLWCTDKVKSGDDIEEYKPVQVEVFGKMESLKGNISNDVQGSRLFRETHKSLACLYFLNVR